MSTEGTQRSSLNPNPENSNPEVSLGTETSSTPNTNGSSSTPDEENNLNIEIPDQNFYPPESEEDIAEGIRERNTAKIEQLSPYNSARYRIHQASSIYFSWTNQFTYILQADFPQTILNGFRPGLMPDSTGINYTNYFFSVISYLSLGLGNTATYKKFISDLFGLEKTKSPSTISQKMLDVLKVNISSVIKGGVSSISFGNSLANVIGYLAGWTNPVKAKVASSVATALFPINWYSQQMNFNYGLSKSDEKSTYNKNCWNSVCDAIPWELIKKVSKIVYPLTSPLTYNVTFQKDFPALVAQITNLIKPEIPQENLKNAEWLGWLTFVINIFCFLALAYDTLKLYNKMDKKKQPEAAASDTPAPSVTGIAGITQKSYLERASQHIAANSKGIISSLGFSEFICQKIKDLWPSTSSRDLAIANITLCLIGIIFNTPAQYASFSEEATLSEPEENEGIFQPKVHRITYPDSKQNSNHSYGVTRSRKPSNSFNGSDYTDFFTVQQNKKHLNVGEFGQQMRMQAQIDQIEENARQLLGFDNHEDDKNLKTVNSSSLYNKNSSALFAEPLLPPQDPPKDKKDNNKLKDICLVM